MARKGQLTPEQKDLRSRFEPALAAYRAAQWDAAESGFRSCLEAVPADGPSTIFLERVAKLLTGADAQTEGVWNLSEK